MTNTRTPRTSTTLTMSVLLMFLVLALTTHSCFAGPEHNAQYPAEVEEEYFDEQVVSVTVDHKEDVAVIPLKYYLELVSRQGGVVYMDCKVIPLYDGPEDFSDANGIYYVWFGYDNQCGMDIRLPIGEYNHFDPKPNNRGQTELFLMGEHRKVMRLPMQPGVTLWWGIRSPDRSLMHVFAPAKYQT